LPGLWVDDDGRAIAGLVVNGGGTKLAVVISIALQHGIAAAALAKSVARMPETLDGLAVKAASPIGQAIASRT
jgi:hypothetical protein